MSSADPQTVTVVLLHALPHSGASWLSLVLGAHEGVLALGPVDLTRPLTPSQFTCCVHGEQCAFWSRVRAAWRDDEHPLLQIADAAGARVLVIITPDPPASLPALDSPKLSVRHILLARDGRSVAASRAAMLAGADFGALCRDWLAPQMARFDWTPDAPGAGGTLCVRYEDFAADPAGRLPCIASFIGVVPDESALRFWERDLHPLGAHPAMLAMIRRHQHLPSPEMRERAFYEEQTLKLLTNPAHRFPADRWRDRLTEHDLLAFDAACGRFNEQMGYERDRFTSDQWRTLSGGDALSSQRVESASRAGRAAAAEPAKSSLATLVVALLSAGLAVLAFLKATGIF